MLLIQVEEEEGRQVQEEPVGMQEMADQVVVPDRRTAPMVQDPRRLEQLRRAAVAVVTIRM